MAINKSIFFKLSGQLNKEVVFKQYGDKTIVSKYPDMSKRVLTPKQLHAQEIMMEANYKAKYIMADEELSREAQARLNVTRNKLYTALVKEYFSAAKQQGPEE